MCLGLRAGDVAGRWGGEEFLVILPGIDLDGMIRAAERIRAATAAAPVTEGRVDVAVTVSGGCALGPGDSSEELVGQADARLYEAKLSGRNQVRAPWPARV